MDLRPLKPCRGNVRNPARRGSSWMQPCSFVMPEIDQQLFIRLNICGTLSAAHPVRRCATMPFKAETKL